MATKFNVAPALSVPFQTTGSTAVVAAYFDVTPYPDCGFWFEVKVIALKSDGTVGATYWRQAAFRVDENGIATQIGATRTVVTDNEDSAGMDVTVAVGTPANSGSGDGATNTEIQVTVTGVAATTINWVLDNTIRHAPFSK